MKHMMVDIGKQMPSGNLTIFNIAIENGDL